MFLFESQMNGWKENSIAFRQALWGKLPEKLGDSGGTPQNPSSLVQWIFRWAAFGETPLIRKTVAMQMVELIKQSATGQLYDAVEGGGGDLKSVEGWIAKTEGMEEAMEQKESGVRKRRVGTVSKVRQRLGLGVKDDFTFARFFQFLGLPAEDVIQLFDKILKKEISHGRALVVSEKN